MLETLYRCLVKKSKFKYISNSRHFAVEIAWFYSNINIRCNGQAAFLALTSNNIVSRIIIKAITEVIFREDVAQLGTKKYITLAYTLVYIIFQGIIE
jgi:hypothetical protein